MLVSLLRAEGCSVCMIHVYTPCRALSNCEIDFRSSLDQNSGKFCGSQQLSLCEDYPIVNTVTHPSVKSQAQIDYVLYMGDSLNVDCLRIALFAVWSRQFD